MGIPIRDNTLDWWPTDREGRLVGHAYRLHDDKAHDMNFQGVPPAISHKILAEHPVDFSDLDVKKLVLQHIDKSSEGNLTLRPFLSTTFDVHLAMSFAASKMFFDGSKVEDNFLVRIDLLEMFRAGLMDENSFATFRPRISSNSVSMLTFSIGP